MKILLSCLILNLEMEPPEYNFLDRFNNAPENSAHAKIESTKLIKVRIGGNFTTENSVASNLSPLISCAGKVRPSSLRKTCFNNFCIFLHMSIFFNFFCVLPMDNGYNHIYFILLYGSIFELSPILS